MSRWSRLFGISVLLRRCRMAQRFDITNGPSKWDLMLALFDTTEDLDPSRCRQNGRLVIFQIVHGGKSWDGDVHINTVKKGQLYGFQENDWDLEGGCTFHGESPFEERYLIKYPFIARFNTQTRKGWLEIAKT